MKNIIYLYEGLVDCKCVVNIFCVIHHRQTLTCKASEFRQCHIWLRANVSTLLWSTEFQKHPPALPSLSVRT